MGLEVKVKRRIVVNGTEYASVEEMPAELRRAFETAMSSREKVSDGEGPARLTVNGQTYGSPDEMPVEVRELYRAAVRLAAEKEAADASRPAATGEPPPWLDEVGAPSPRPIGPGGTAPGARLVLVVVGLLVLAWLVVQLLSHLGSW